MGVRCSLNRNRTYETKVVMHAGDSSSSSCWLFVVLLFCCFVVCCLLFVVCLLEIPAKTSFSL